MASPRAYRVKLAQVDAGQTSESATTLKKGVTRNENQPIDATVILSTAQFQGLTNYLALAKAGDDTSSVETAITALL